MFGRRRREAYATGRAVGLLRGRAETCLRERLDLLPDDAVKVGPHAVELTVSTKAKPLIFKYTYDPQTAALITRSVHRLRVLQGARRRHL
jgi:hypothetical protein